MQKAGELRATAPRVSNRCLNTALSGIARSVHEPRGARSRNSANAITAACRKQPIRPPDVFAEVVSGTAI